MNQVNLKKLKLYDFRNYHRKEVIFNNTITWFTGPNGSGKTNILEAIYLLSTGKSRRVRKNDELIRWGTLSSKILGSIEVLRNEEIIDKEELEVVIGIKNGDSSVSALKQLKVNGVGRHLTKYVGHLPSVWFGPEDLDLVSGSGSLRRGFLDQIWEQVDGEYRRALSDYEKAQRRRNQLLSLINEGGCDRSVLSYYDTILTNAGKYIQLKRQELITALNLWFEGDNDFEVFRLEYDWSEMSRERLDKYANQEIQAGMTLVGPHRDDVVVKMCWGGDDWKLIDRYGSRGQQRMGVLGMKIAQLEFLGKINNSRPVLLLDDVMSELDDKHKQIVLGVMEKQQTVVSGVEK